MSIEMHITRAKYWPESENNPIQLDEWLEFVAGDPSLSLDESNGSAFALWSGQCEHGDRTWFDWLEGQIFTKNPDSAILRKMLAIAKHFSAKLQDDDGYVYEDDSGYPINKTQNKREMDVSDEIDSAIDLEQSSEDPDFEIGDRVRDLWGNHGTIEKIDVQAEQGLGVIGVKMDDGRSVMTALLASGLEKAEEA